MNDLVNAVLRLNLIPTYANGQYDDSHEWECECDNHDGCECRDYDLDGRDEDEHDREMAETHADGMSDDLKACVLAGYKLILTHEARGDKAEAEVIVDEIRAEVHRINQAAYEIRMAEWMAAQPPLSEQRRRYEAAQIEQKAELAQILANQKAGWAAADARLEAQAEARRQAAIQQSLARIDPMETLRLQRAAAFATTSRGRRLLAQRRG